MDRRPAPLSQAVPYEIQLLAGKGKICRPFSLLHTLVERVGAGTVVASLPSRATDAGGQTAQIDAAPLRGDDAERSAGPDQRLIW